MIVTTVALTAIIAFGVVAWQVIRSDDDRGSTSAGSWDRLALVDRTTGAVTVVDPDGEVDHTLVGRGRVEAAHSIGDRFALVGREQIVLEGGDEEAQVIPIARSATVTPIRTAETLHLVVGEPSGGNVVVVDVGTGELLDVGAIAEQPSPRLFPETIQQAPDGERFALADAAAFQTIVVEQGETEAQFFAAQPVALDDERVATSQIVGRQADVAIFDRRRQSKARVPTEIPAGGILVDGELTMVSTDGGVFRVTDGATEAEKIGELAVPSGGAVDWVRPALGGDRLVVGGTVFQAVIDLDGQTLFTTTFTAPVSVDQPRVEWRCLPIGGEDTYHSIVSLDTGQQLADLSGLTVTGWSGDGCTVIGERGAVTEVVSAEGSVSLGTLRAAHLGPDGLTVVRTTTGGTTDIVTITDDLTLGDPVDITDLTPGTALIAFLS